MLGDGFEQLTLPLGTDDEGEVVATLVRYTPQRMRWFWEPRGAASGADVLYVHGWSDYFFNPELAGSGLPRARASSPSTCASTGAACGPVRRRATSRTSPTTTPISRRRSARWATVQTDDVGDIRSRPLILLGHSTGGLTLSLWSARHPGRAAALVLNSPWLEFQGSRIGREVLTPVISWGARTNPMGPMPNVDLGFYTRTVSKEFDGEWEYSHEWRPERGFTVYPAWLTAILAGHATVAAGIDVGAPVLTLLSARSTIQPRWDPAMLTTDIVLVVENIAQRSLKLGPQVSVAWIDGALHDVFLSRQPARAQAYASIYRWLRGYAPGRERARRADATPADATPRTAPSAPPTAGA